MTKDEILKKANYLFFNHKENKNCYFNKYSYFKYFLDNLSNDNNKKLEIVCDDLAKYRYVNNKSNSHHFTTEYHYKFVIPKLNNLLNIDIDVDKDFYLIKNFDENGNDFSYLYPKKDKEFHITYLELQFDKEKKYIEKSYWKEISGPYKIMIGKSKNLENLGFKNTMYHELFFNSHYPTVIENNDATYNRTLLISGSSHNIPTIPVLAYYYRKIIFLDVRDRITYQDLWKDEEIDDVLLTIHNGEVLDKFINTNFL